MISWLSVGDIVYFKTDKKPYTVNANNDSFTICTKPFNIKKTCLYTIIDWQQEKRNKNNMVFNPYNYMEQEDIDRCLADLSDSENVVNISSRRPVKLDIVRVVRNGQEVVFQ
jgi:hypothetical protein